VQKTYELTFSCVVSLESSGYSKEEAISRARNELLKIDEIYSVEELITIKEIS